MKALLGTKLGMTQIFDEAGNVQRVTVIEAGPCVVTQVKTKDSDGYNAIQIGYGDAKHQKRPQMGHLKAANVNSSVLREIRLQDIDPTQDTAADEATEATTDLKLEIGSRLDVTSFEVGDAVEVVGTSKGKGFAGTVKRHNFNTGPKTHGSHNYRAPGSIGAGYPEHVMKGMKMAGRMGGDRVTAKGGKIVLVDAEKNLLAVSGAIPGPRKGIVMIRGAK
jgi:large subunit ribosomal protein L3